MRTRSPLLKASSHAASTRPAGVSGIFACSECTGMTASIAMRTRAGFTQRRLGLLKDRCELDICFSLESPNAAEHETSRWGAKPVLLCSINPREMRQVGRLDVPSRGLRGD